MRGGNGETIGMTKAFACFDLGGTLVELRGMIEIVASLIQDRSTPPSSRPAELARRWAIATAAALPQAQGPAFRAERLIAARVLRNLLVSSGLEASEDDALQLIRAAWSAFASSATLYSEVTDAWWDEIHESVQRIALVTDIDVEAADSLLDRLGLRRHFDAIILSETEHAYKPDPVLYRRALEALRTEAGQCLFISDSSLDLIGARKEGMHTALIQRAPQVNSLSPPPDTLLLTSLEELPSILTGYEQAGRFRRS